MLCLSKAGAAVLQAKGAKLVSVTSVQGCKLEQLCDTSVHLPLERELCPFDLAPVTSTAIQMLFGDTVAIALMQVLSACAQLVPAGALWHQTSHYHARNSPFLQSAGKGGAPLHTHIHTACALMSVP